MGRTPCCDKANVKKGPWSPEEDAKLKDFIEKYGTGGNWIALPQKAGLRRCGKSCRLRWLNYLRPNIKHGDFSEDEDRIICRLYSEIGTKWSIIAAHLPGRTDNDIKNYWNTKLKRKHMAATNNNSIIQNPNSQFYPLTQSPLFQSQPSLYRDYYTAALSMNMNASLSGLHQPVPTIWNNSSNIINFPHSLAQMSLNQWHSIPMQHQQSQNLGRGLMFGATADQASSGSSEGSCSQITQDHNMSVTTNGGFNGNYLNSYMQLDFGNTNNTNANGGGFGDMGIINNPSLMQSYDHLQDVKPLINSSSNDFGYLGLNDEIKKRDEREEMYCNYYY